MTENVMRTVYGHSAVIRCLDKRLLRLLEIELSLCGVVTVDEDQPYDLLLWDLDDFPQLPSAEDNIAILCWSREDTPDNVLDQEKKRFLHRPFDLQDFENTVRFMIGSIDGSCTDERQRISLSFQTRVAISQTKKHAVDHEGEGVISFSEGKISVLDEEISLTPREHALFSCLWAQRGNAVPKAVLWEALCTVTEAGTPVNNSLEVYICHLRRKLERPSIPRLITTVRGVGYRLNCE